MPKDPSDPDEDVDGGDDRDDLFDADLGSLMAGHLLDDDPLAPAPRPDAPPSDTTDGTGTSESTTVGDGSPGAPSTNAAASGTSPDAAPPVDASAAEGAGSEPPEPSAPKRKDANPALSPDDLLAERQRKDAERAADHAAASPAARPDTADAASNANPDAAGANRASGAATADGEDFEAALARAVAEDEAATSNGHRAGVDEVVGASAPVDVVPHPGGPGHDAPVADELGEAPGNGNGTTNGNNNGAAPPVGEVPPGRPTMDAGGPPPAVSTPTPPVSPSQPPEAVASPEGAMTGAGTPEADDAPPTDQVPSVERTRRDTDEMPAITAADIDDDSLTGHATRRSATNGSGPADPQEPSMLTEPEPRGKSRTRSFVEWVLAIVIALVTAFLVKTFVLQAFVIPSASMRPTLVEGDRVLVSKLDIGEIGRGDVIVFDNPARLPNEPAQLIKRVIGVEGDVLEARDGTVLVNGQALDEGYLDDGTLTRELEQTTVPDDHVFVMGDNRPNSRDSRFIGAIDVDDVVGEAFLIIWPPARIATL
ncbi:MAG: signal peptidase I [Actinomycetota bacterium]|nr:signal peptidase I [Actinomycetota bacterium]